MDVKLPDGKTQKLKAYFREFTKEEKAQQDELIKELKNEERNAKSIMKEISRLKEKRDIFKKLGDQEALLSLLDDLYSLEDKLEAINIEMEDRDIDSEVMKFRFDTCLGGKDADTIMEYAKTQGYIRVFDVIRKSILEEQEKN